ncbi:uncharacterized protein CIMG_09463 [Coccidioides immitis RS]|uniref:Uncharacterized protein n=1 Tax=Coccidioides immitis (strain RS) TaxID=246410 RepID=J3K2E9_COCIM|nr:uncharacterized protein CIMG_09463 [Coccidioides immitis RS]EAS28259.3 hypothetical protein CIMG_09463 [Coccidioides immitis RS]
MTRDNQYGITILRDPATHVAAGGRAVGSDGIVFDLVAIHGLNGDPIKTWTHGETGVMWLKDLLPEAIPNIRIMTFGFNACLNSFTARLDLHAISTKLLTELVDVRTTEDEKSRSLVFVCHSLGGIVAKKALLIGCSEEQERVQQSVHTILFHGTPQYGNGAVMGKLLANIAFTCSPMKAPRALIGMLRKEPEAILEITGDFIKRRKKVHLMSFYELELTSIGPFFRKMVPDAFPIVRQQFAISRVPHEITIPQFSDHRNLVRFRSPQDRCFLTVASRLKNIAEELRPRCTKQTPSGPESGDFAILFDINAQPCPSFRGRDDVFRLLRAYFHGDHDHAQRRRTFALCGLGGSGIAFINASSSASLEADFGRLHDLLELGEPDDKIGSVRRWLARPRNSHWLLIFDNADNLESVRIQRCFPAVNWGHIIITTRDQGAIGSITEEGHVLRPLMTEDAIQLLLDKSGIRHPTQGDTEDARVIAEFLGSLPLALVQAGTFIRSRHRSLREYCTLYMTHRNELLRFTSHPGDAEMPVLTAWEINFKQVERESPEAFHLLLLFSFLEPWSIPEMLLQRGSSPQKRWGTNGEVEEIRAEEEGVDVNLTRFIQDDFEFDTAMEKLLSFSLISCGRGSDGLRTFSIHPLVQYCAVQRLSPSETRRWRWQALLLVCHAFPRSRYIEPLNGPIGRTIFPHLSRVLSEYDSMALEDGEPTSFRHELAACLLAASRFSNAKWKVEAISRAKKLLEGDDDPFLNAWLAYRESSVMRMSGMTEESERVLHTFLRVKATPLAEKSELTQRFNAKRGDLIISLSENLVRQGKLAEAKAELIEWEQLSTEISTLEKLTSRARNMTLGKILRLQGKFKEALEQLDSVLQSGSLDDYFKGTGWYRVLLSEVAGLHCELGQPVEAEKLLLQELASMREKGTQNIATGRRLQMSLAETFLQRNMYAEAETLLYDLRRAFLSPDNLDYNAKFNGFRVWVSLARVSHKQSHWEDALTRWKHALSALEGLKLDETFNAGLVQSSLTHLMMVTGHETEATHMLQRARSNMKSEPRLFWVPLFNSQWHDFIIESLQGLKVDCGGANVNHLSIIHITEMKGKGSTCDFSSDVPSCA